MTDDRTVAGMRCSEVLERLSAYVDGELERDTRARINDHLAACHRCEQFGGTFGAIVGALQRSLATPEAVPEHVAQRLESLFDDKSG